MTPYAEEETLTVPASLYARIRHHAGTKTDSEYLDSVVPDNDNHKCTRFLPMSCRGCQDRVGCQDVSE